MNYIVENDYIKIEKNFDLAQTLDCGQAFRWKEEEGFWCGIAFGKFLKLKQDESFIYFYCGEKDFNEVWAEYFDLNTDYEEIKAEISRLDERLIDITKFAPGIRILKQDAWEGLCSFIISQNNNIARIKGIVQRLCENFGEKTDFGYTFPSLETIAKCSEDDLAPIKSGFRAKYILSAANMLNDGEIDVNDIKEMDIDKAREELKKIKGVGPKVADCALLYGFYKTECFPMDVWMIRAMKELLPNLDPKDLGKNAGIAQQYIFHYSRHHL